MARALFISLVRFLYYLNLKIKQTLLDLCALKLTYPIYTHAIIIFIVYTLGSNEFTFIYLYKYFFFVCIFFLSLNYQCKRFFFFLFRLYRYYQYIRIIVTPDFFHMINGKKLCALSGLYLLRGWQSSHLR